MDTGSLFSVVHESIFLILAFAGFLCYAMIRGRQSIINLILSLYLALLISLQFPYFSFFINGSEDKSSDAIVMIVIFAVFAILGSLLFGKLMPQEYDETAFQNFGRKILYALIASILVMAYSYHALPVTDIITPGSPIQSLFGPESNFFWWLMLPLVVIYLL
jgi:hypothetical protein